MTKIYLIFPTAINGVSSFPSSCAQGLFDQDLTAQDLIVDQTRSKTLIANGTRIYVHPAFLGEKEMEYANPDFSFGTAIKNIRIKTPQGVKTLNFGEKNQERLMAYLKDGRSKVCEFNKDEFDCFCFGHYIKNIRLQFLNAPGAPLKILKSAYSYLKKTDEKGIEEGDLIQMKKPGTNFFHYALYLGEGLYVSKFGRLGLFFSDLEAMENFFGPEDETGFILSKVMVIEEFQGPRYGREVEECSVEVYANKIKTTYANPESMWEKIVEIHGCSKDFDDKVKSILKKNKKLWPC